jgi:hypothetical protein
MAYMGAVAAAAAEKRRQRLHAEEERMVHYAEGDLEDDWEFKIVRSDTAAFRKPDVLERLIQEEARAGWVMLEKFDDSRIRFKRRRSARARDVLLPEGVDPYRTRYGSGVSRQVAMVVVGLTVFLLLGGALLAFSMLGKGAHDMPPIIAPLIVGLLVFVVLAFVVLIVVAVKQRQS